MDGDALTRGQNVLSHQAGRPPELHRLSIEKDAPVAQHHAHFGERLKGRDGAVDVELRVRPGVPPVGHRKGDQVIAVLLKQRRRFLNQVAPLLERQRAQGGAAFGPGKLESQRA